MKTIKNAIFLMSEENFDKFSGFGLPEVVFVGRSNVGKSSLINMLASNTKLAKVSSVQGKTKLINFYKCNNEFVLVDVPGYGYAKSSHIEQNKWKNMINSYFANSKNLKMVVLIVDIRHKPTDKDIQMMEYLTYQNISTTIVATKYDKLKKSEVPLKINDIAGSFKVGIENIYIVSSQTGYGKSNLIQRIYQFVGDNE